MLTDEWLQYWGPAFTDRWDIKYYPAQWHHSMLPPKGATVLAGGISCWEVKEEDRDPIVMATWMSCEEALMSPNMSPSRKKILYQTLNRLPLDFLQQHSLFDHEATLAELLEYTDEKRKEQENTPSINPAPALGYERLPTSTSTPALGSERHSTTTSAHK